MTRQNLMLVLVKVIIVLGLCQGGTASASTMNAVVFDNTALNGGVIISSYAEGCEVHLAGDSRVVNEIDLGMSNQGFAGSATLQLWFYANNGPGGAPSTQLWYSGDINNVALAGPPQLVDFSVPSVLVPDTFTWIAQISNASGAASVSTISPCAVGRFLQFWLYEPGYGWFQMPNGEPTARILAVPEPSAFALLAAAAVGSLLFYFRRLTKYGHTSLGRQGRSLPS